MNTNTNTTTEQVEQAKASLGLIGAIVGLVLCAGLWVTVLVPALTTGHDVALAVIGAVMVAPFVVATAHYARSRAALAAA